LATAGSVAAAGFAVLAAAGDYDPGRFPALGHGMGLGFEHPWLTVDNALVLEPGMCLAIEPMITLGTWDTKVLKDGWTVVTKDGETVAGRLDTETATSVEILDTAGQKHAIQRKDIRSIEPSNQSIMPGGFEQLPADDLAGLLEYLAASAKQGK
jgi:hypothetical protein